jgi:hypothetical protein
MYGGMTQVCPRAFPFVPSFHCEVSLARKLQREVRIRDSGDP